MEQSLEFVNREKELKELKGLLSGRPNFVYFVYGPINTGKSTLLMKVFEELPDDYRIFYINFRGFEGGYTKFTRALFKLGDKNLWEKIKSNMPILSAAVEYVEKLAKKINTAIELPSEIIKMLQVGEDDPEKIDMFNYLEEVMKKFKEKKKKAVFVLDEMQVLKGELNTVGKPLVERLFNFMVRLTKETHLCHCLCATSDCLFIEDVYNNARLEGRAKYVLIDDLEKEDAFKVYETFGFKDKELIWNYIGGKIGDIISLYEDKKRGYSEDKALKQMLKNEVARIEWIKWKKLKKMEKGEQRWGVLKRFKEKEEVKREEIEEEIEDLLFWTEENVLFYNPIEGIIKPQGRLIAKAIKELN